MLAQAHTYAHPTHQSARPTYTAPSLIIAVVEMVGSNRLRNLLSNVQGAGSPRASVPLPVLGGRNPNFVRALKVSWCAGSWRWGAGEEGWAVRVNAKHPTGCTSHPRAQHHTQAPTFRMASNASSMDSRLGSCQRYCSNRKFRASCTSSKEASLDRPSSLVGGGGVRACAGAGVGSGQGQGVRVLAAAATPACVSTRAAACGCLGSHEGCCCCCCCCRSTLPLPQACTRPLTPVRVALLQPGKGRVVGMSLLWRGIPVPTAAERGGAGCGE